MAIKSDPFIASEDDEPDAVSEDEEYGKKKKKRVKEEKEEDDDEDEKPHKKAKSDPLKQNSEGDSYLELSSNRRITVRQFKNNVLIDLRETYDKDGKTGLPGKKGISLTAEQWQKLKEGSDLIDQAIADLK